MLKVPLNLASEGMVLAMPVLHPRLHAHVLLRPGFALNGATLKRLRELGVGDLWIVYPALASAAAYVNPQMTMAHAYVTTLIGRALDQLRQLPEHRHAELDFRPYVESVRDLIERVSGTTGARLLVHDLLTGDTPLARHSGSVCFLSLLMGLKLEAYFIEQRRKIAPARAKSIDNLVVGALLHDVGMARVPQDVLAQVAATGDESAPMYQAHVRAGYELVRDQVEPTAAVAVLQHHQRLDGRGYPRLRIGNGKPRALRGEEIHVFARVISVADRFDRLRHPPLGGGDPGPAVVSVLKQIVEQARAGIVDPVVVKGLLSVVPAFAPGSLVRLDDGRRAVVAEFDPLHPCRPTVQVLKPAARGGLLAENGPGERIDLRASDRRIVEIDDRDVSGDYFEAREPAEFDVRIPVAPYVVHVEDEGEGEARKAA